MTYKPLPPNKTFPDRANNRHVIVERHHITFNYMDINGIIICLLKLQNYDE